jgi:hypothetical protein
MNEVMDGQTRFFKIRELQNELHADGCSDERAIEIYAEIRKIEAKPKATRKPKREREQYMTVLGGYVLDMHDHGKLVGTIDAEGHILRRL